MADRLGRAGSDYVGWSGCGWGIGSAPTGSRLFDHQGLHAVLGAEEPTLLKCLAIPSAARTGIPGGVAETAFRATEIIGIGLPEPALNPKPCSALSLDRRTSRSIPRYQIKLQAVW
jgi:hypothetical protein